MAESETVAESEEPPVDLRNSTLAAIVGWLIPGAGHLYQRRYSKGVFFAVCVLTTYFYGLSLGGGHVVYASWKREDFRWQYVCQAGVGLPALPALLQSRRVMRGQEPLVADVLAPPRQPVYPNDADHLAEWHLEHKWRFDLGTLYTMIAGLMNILAVYDAYAGPFVAHAMRAKAERDEQVTAANKRPPGTT
ncbi:MAG: DUF6677 family protein [Pirellulales bacterium]